MIYDFCDVLPEHLLFDSFLFYYAAPFSGSLARESRHRMGWDLFLPVSGEPVEGFKQ